MTTADTVISSIKVLAALVWQKQIDMAGYWLVQHTAPVSASQTVGHVYKGHTINTRQAVQSYLT